MREHELRRRVEELAQRERALRHAFERCRRAVDKAFGEFADSIAAYDYPFSALSEELHDSRKRKHG
jgi:hypothetical protein